MTDPTIRDRPRAPTHDGVPTRRRSGALAWLLVLLALIAAVWYFAGRGDPPDPAPRIDDVAPGPSRSPVSSAPAERETAPERATPVAPIERPAQPIDPRQPEYPPAALRAGEEGSVLLRVDVGADGRPTAVQLVEGSGSAELDRAAQRAVRQWAFQPATRDGKAVPSSVQVPVDFRVDRQ